VGSGPEEGSVKAAASPPEAPEALTAWEDAVRFTGLESHFAREVNGVRRNLEVLLGEQSAPTTERGKGEARRLRAKLALVGFLASARSEPDAAFFEGLVLEFRTRCAAERPRFVTLAMAAASLFAREPSLAIEPNGDGTRRLSHDAPLRRGLFVRPDNTRIRRNARPAPSPPSIVPPPPSSGTRPASATRKG
jgi:hypothetical protein